MPKPKLYVYAPSYIEQVEVPEFDVVWKIAEIDLEQFLDYKRGQCRADVAVKKSAPIGEKPAVFILAPLFFTGLPRARGPGRAHQGVWRRRAPSSPGEGR
ncbi:hypothetical protein Pisl_1810 [Pyrobaculum islandicum DSM 4184]|uniref:Uncharacterized protein n=1 Tax=Pyrobaculum islandicum (strain DSM 4184 / JCM 9189 / GEO3) TaxID=384616 RepID=A1RVH7_PYRIL|nr:hypothetical protein [Pyrobaculum islandicum]ABL88959.1 hypothetical protein Pisl_1810 [Pyrobaculum islandicum DSM 4184]